MKFYHAILALVVAGSAQAAEITPYLGLNAGYDYLRAPAPESEKEGYDLGVKFVPSFEMKRFFVDPGVGYQKEVVEGRDRQIDTQSGFAELAIRPKINDHWSLGPIGQLHFGIDNRRQEGPTRDDSTMSNAGAQLIYQGKAGRFEMAALSSTGGTGFSDERRLTTVKLGFQINMFGPQKDRVVTKIVDRPVPVIIEREVVVAEVPNMVLNMDANSVHFKTASHALDAKSEQRIRRIGEYLASHDVKVARIKVGGHTDSRGSQSYNQKLSERRAETVRKVLESTGVKAPIESEGFNYSRPIAEGNNEAAWSQNRRTEIEFYGLEAPENTKAELESILKD